MREASREAVGKFAMISTLARSASEEVRASCALLPSPASIMRVKVWTKCSRNTANCNSQGQRPWKSAKQNASQAPTGRSQIAPLGLATRCADTKSRGVAPGYCTLGLWPTMFRTPCRQLHNVVALRANVSDRFPLDTAARLTATRWDQTREGTMSTIVDIHGRQILDSRGNPTVEVDVTLGRRLVRPRQRAQRRQHRRARSLGTARHRPDESLPAARA